MNARSGLRVVVTGATGNVGISVMKALAADESIASILGLARRLPALSLPKAAWGVVDLSQLGSAGRLAPTSRVLTSWSTWPGAFSRRTTRW